MEAYEADIRNSLLTEQLQATIAATDFLTPGETRRLLALMDEEREVRFALLQPEAFAGNAPVDAAAIEAYYKAYAAQFAVPESVKLDYAELSLPAVAANLNVSESSAFPRPPAMPPRYRTTLPRCTGTGHRWQLHPACPRDQSAGLCTIRQTFPPPVPDSSWK